MKYEFLFRAPHTKVALLRSQAKKLSKSEGMTLAQAQNVIAEDTCGKKWSAMMRHDVAYFDGRYLFPPHPHSWMALDIDFFPQEVSDFDGTFLSFKGLVKTGEGDLRAAFGYDEEPNELFDIDMPMSGKAANDIIDLLHSEKTILAYSKFLSLLSDRVEEAAAKPELRFLWDGTIDETAASDDLDDIFDVDQVVSDIARAGAEYVTFKVCLLLLKRVKSPFLCQTLASNDRLTVDYRRELLEMGQDEAAQNIHPGDIQSGDLKWYNIEHRDYMRGLLAMAVLSEEAGNLPEAIQGYRDLVKMNPNDNQGVRYPLMSALMKDNDYPGAQEIVDQYHSEDGTAMMDFAAALCALNREGNTEDVRAMFGGVANPYLSDVIRQARHRGKGPEVQGTHYALGSPDEALVIVDTFPMCWKTELPIEDFMWGADKPTHGSKM